MLFRSAAFTHSTAFHKIIERGQRKPTKRAGKFPALILFIAFAGNGIDNQPSDVCVTSLSFWVSATQSHILTGLFSSQTVLAIISAVSQPFSPPLPDASQAASSPGQTL